MVRRGAGVLYGAVVPLGDSRSGRALAAACVAVLLAGAARARAAEPETIGAVRTLAERPGPHWFWLSDIIMHRVALFDGDSGGMLG